MMNIDFSSRLQGLLKETNTTRQQLAIAIGVSHQSVTQWQSGQTIPDILKFKKIAEYFDVSYDYLLGDSKSKKNENERVMSDLGLTEGAIETLMEAGEFTALISAFLENNDFMIFVTMVDDLLS
ncbi:MAG: helix-turn-helix domain-containing protein, partial [Oscillospiraceae bacterium]|nr:helix-turn-helix domain-containing protein [Oscillospiraceae bacterium]